MTCYREIFTNKLHAKKYDSCLTLKWITKELRERERERERNGTNLSCHLSHVLQTPTSKKVSSFSSSPPFSFHSLSLPLLTLPLSFFSKLLLSLDLFTISPSLLRSLPLSHSFTPTLTNTGWSTHV